MLSQQKKLGKIIRQINPAPEPKPSQNCFLNYVPQFIYPLLNVQNVGPHLELYVRDFAL